MKLPDLISALAKLHRADSTDADNAVGPGDFADATIDQLIEIATNQKLDKGVRESAVEVLDFSGFLD